MRESDEHDTPRPRPRKKAKKRSAEEAPDRRLPLLIGGGVGAALLLGLVIWGIMRLFSPGGAFGAVAAEARPAAQDGREYPLFAPGKAPGDAADWKATPDGATLTTGLTSVTPLPEGFVWSVLFADPASGKAAVVLGADYKGGDINLPMALEWLQVDLKAGRVTAKVPLGVGHVGAPAVSPSGDRLAFVRGGFPPKLEVWDASGKQLLSNEHKTTITGDWFAFLGEGRLLSVGGDKLAALDVATGQPAFVAATAARPPLALSAGRKWLAATNAAGELNVFATADGSVAGRWPKPPSGIANLSSIAFSPDGATLAAMYGPCLVTWDAATGKVTRTSKRQIGGTLGHRDDGIQWLGPKHMMFGSFLYDNERDLGLWRYHIPGRVGHGLSPDGRLWVAGSYKRSFEGQLPSERRKETPGPLLDLVKKGQVLTAFTLPHDDVVARVAAADAGFAFQPGKPIRIEFTGRGSAENKRVLAEAAAEAAAKRGIAIDPEAKVGVRIDVSAVSYRKSVTVNPVTGKVIENKAAPPVAYPFVGVTYSLFSTASGAATKPHPYGDFGGNDKEDGWEVVMFRRIGKSVGESASVVRASGYFGAKGEDVRLNQESDVGIDGVLGAFGGEPMGK